MKTLFVLLMLTLFALPACHLQDEENYEFQEIKLSEKTAHLIKSENDFGLELFKNVYVSETEKENILLSPLSVGLALAMTYNGANGETKTAIEKTLKLYGLTPEEINESYNTLISSLKSLDGKVLIELANAIIFHQDFYVEKDFISTNEYYYKALVAPLDFNNEHQSLQSINGWVSEKTNNKIESIIDRILPEQVMFLLNAIYFKGIWQKEFNPDNTKQLPFTTIKGEILQAETMQKADNVPYVAHELFTAIQLNYGRGNYSMSILLPNAGHDLNELIDNLNAHNWKTWTDSFTTNRNVAISLPKFSYAYEIELTDVLNEMGMGIAFTPNADFSGINPTENLFINFVKHKSFVEVNEEGTEAAAVTAVGMVLVSVGNDDPIPFVADRPFLYAITEKSTGAVLFMGTIKNPLMN